MPGTTIPLTSMRRTIAKRLSESAFTAPHFFVTVEIDMDAAVSLREQLQRAEDVKVSFNDLVLKACARALTRFPTVNASWTGEAIQTHAEVHVGVAVSLAEGLITPVVRNADRKHVVEISREVKDLAARAREKKLKPEEFMGSTFTISNLGMFDVTEFTAIINPPESCILAVGAVRKVPVVKDDQLAIGHRMKVTLSSDHRVVDGALAAQFLAEVQAPAGEPGRPAAVADRSGPEERLARRGGLARELPAGARRRLLAGLAGEVVEDDLLDAVPHVVGEGAEGHAEPGREAVHRVVLLGVRPGHDAVRHHLALAAGHVEAELQRAPERGHDLVRHVGAEHVDVHDEGAVRLAARVVDLAASHERHADRAAGPPFLVAHGCRHVASILQMHPTKGQ